MKKKTGKKIQKLQYFCDYFRQWYGKPIIELIQRPGDTLYVPRFIRLLTIFTDV